MTRSVSCLGLISPKKEAFSKQMKREKRVFIAHSGLPEGKGQTTLRSVVKLVRYTTSFFTRFNLPLLEAAGVPQVKVQGASSTTLPLLATLSVVFTQTPTGDIARSAPSDKKVEI